MDLSLSHLITLILFISIVSENALLLFDCQAVIWTNDDLSSIRQYRFWIEINIFSFPKVNVYEYKIHKWILIWPQGDRVKLLKLEFSSMNMTLF